MASIPASASTRLCARCSTIQIPEKTAERALAFESYPHHQTFEEFSEAARQKCYICLTLWIRLANSIDRLKDSWTPKQFWIQKDFAGRDLYKFNVLYSMREIIQFRITPCHDDAALPIQACAIGNSTFCASSIQTALGWLQSCRSGHKQCGWYFSQEKSWHPSRLLDLGSKESTSWKLHSTAKDGPVPDQEPYIALSYRWGPNPQLLLLSTTIDDFRQGKLIQDLPKTFRDLTTVARELSIRYVWIDALCILQDSDEDWYKEALTMRHVYVNAACTVAASASSNEQDGLFCSRDPETILPAVAHLSTVSGPKPFRIFERDYWDRHISVGPLHKRGWAFQERHLSPRVLYFGGAQLLWECFETVKCEGFPDGIPFHWSDKNLLPLWDLVDTGNLCPAPPAQVRPAMPMSVYSLWRDLVKSYSQCALTKPADKLPAFAGLAKLFQQATGDEYLAGLWRSRLLEGLDWRVEEPGAKSSGEYWAPSWSWASVDGPLRPELPSAFSTQLAEVIDAEIELRGPEPTGPVSGGWLKIRGLVVRGVLEVVERDGRWRVAIEPEHTVGTSEYFPKARLLFRLDYQGIKLCKKQELHFLALNSSLVGHLSDMKPRVVCIILRPTSDVFGKRKYSRIGHVLLEDQEQMVLFNLHALKNGLMVSSGGKTLTTIEII